MAPPNGGTEQRYGGRSGVAGVEHSKGAIVAHHHGRPDGGQKTGGPAPAASGLHDRPVIGAAREDWDWYAWARATGFDPARFTIRHRLDADAAAIEATLADLDVALVSVPLVLSAFADARLTPVPGQAAAEIGRFALTVPPVADRRAVNRFTTWLAARAAETEAETAGTLASLGIPIRSRAETDTVP